MQKTSSFIFALVLFISCSPTDHEVELQIRNDSGNPVSDIRFYTTNGKESWSADALPPGTGTSHTLAVANYHAVGDYTFEFTTRDGEKITATGNYFEEEYIKNTLTFIIEEEGVRVEKKVVKHKD